MSDGLVYGNAGQLLDQTLAVLAAPTYAFVVTFALLKLIGLVMPLRGTEREEAVGMDVVQHGEEAYVTGEGVADLQALLGVLLEAASGEFLLSVEGLDNRAGVADQVDRLRASLEAIRHAVQMLIPS